MFADCIFFTLNTFCEDFVMKLTKLFDFVVLLPPLILTLLSIPAVAQEQPNPDMEKQAPIIVREQTIYVPYENLRKTFEKEGRGVYLPYEQFHKLWDEVQKGREKPVPQPLVSPFPFMMTESVSEAIVSEEIVKVESRIRIELLQKGWVEVPLRLSDVAISKAELGGQPAKLLGKTGEGFRVLLEAEDSSQSVELVLHYAKAIEKTPGRNSVSFEVPQAPISRWKVRVPESDVKIDFSPFIAVAEEKAEEKTDETPEKAPDETVLLAFAGGAPTIRIAWTPKTEGATGLEALTSVQMEQRVFLEEGVLRTEARLDYAISRSQIENVAIEIPDDQKVLEVFDPNIRRWTVEQRDGKQILNVDLFEPAKTLQSVNLKLERFIGMESGQQATQVEIPKIVAVGVGRQQGVLVVQTAGELSTDPQRTTGLVQMDESELPQMFRGTRWNHAYRVSSSNYGLVLQAEKVLPRVSAVSQAHLIIAKDAMHCFLNIQYQIERAGVFQLACDIPEGWNVASVTGISTPTGGVGVESHNIGKPDENSMQRLTINLARKAIGNVRLAVQLSKPPGEVSPEKPLDFAFSLPMVAKDSVHRRETKLAVSVKDNFRVTPSDLVGLQTIPVEQLQMQWTGEMMATPVTHGGTHLGFVGGEEPASLKLKIEQRQPQVTIRQALQVQVESGVVKYTARFYYSVLYNGVKSLRIDVPETIAGKFRNPTIRETRMETQPSDVEKDYVAYLFEKDDDWFGAGMFELVWEEEIKRLDIGKETPVSVPRLMPRNVDRAFGQIVIAHAETISLRESEETRGLRAIDPQSEVLPPDRLATAIAAMEFFDDWKLDLLATRFQNEEVKRASIEEGVLQVVSVRSGENLTARGIYRIRSVKQRLGVTLPEGAIVNEVRINGRPVTLESGGDTTEAAESGKRLYLIPLNSVTPDTPFQLELRYMYPGTIASISVPAFPGESLVDSGSIPAVQKMSLIVYVPENSVVVHHKGAWTPHFCFHADFPSTRVGSEPSINSVLDAVRQGVVIPPGQVLTLGNFPVAGSAYLFTTLQPGTTPDDALQLTAMTEKGLKGIVFVFLALVGIVLALFRWRVRLIGAIVLALFLLCGGICCPTTKMYLFQQKVFVDLLWLIVLLWCVVSLFRWARAVYVNACQLKAQQPQSATDNADAPEKEPDNNPENPENSENRSTEGGN